MVRTEHTVVGTHAALLVITAPGTYTVTVTAANGCTDTESVAVTQNITPPVAAITNNTGSTELTCSRTSISVTATGGGTYSWSDGSTVVGTNALLLITAPGTYTVTVTAANGCTDTESVAVTQNITPPVAAITNNTGSTELTCSRTSISVTATGGGTYSWSNGTSVVGTAAALSITAPGTYTVTVTAANGCTDTESVAVTQNITPPVAAITNNTGSTELTCSRTSISVTATGGGTYSWSNGSTVVGTAAALSITAPGTYTVTVTGANGCTDTESVAVTQNITPPVAAITNNTGSTELTCSRTSISVTATGGGTYSWSDGSTVVGTAAALSITAPGTYTVTVTAANGCTDTESVAVTQNITPPVAAITNNTGSTELTCSRTSISVTATGGGTYSWSNGSTVVGTAAALSITAPGTYTVTVTAANGCTDTESVAVTQNITPPVAAITNNTGSTELTCSRTSISVTATGGGTYSWSNGSTVVGTAAALSITAPGTYTVTVTAANGCTDTESVAVTQNITPPVAAITNNTGSTELTCSRTSISVTATGGGTYSWSDGSTVVGTAAALSITAPGTYTVTVTAANGCTDTESVAVTQNITPPVAAITNNTGSTELTCSRTSISVTATGGGTYSWSNGTSVVGTAAALSITAPGTYTVTVTAANGCTDTESVAVTQNITPPVAAITNNTGSTELTCSRTSISVTATGGGTYSWSDGSTVVGTAAALSITAPGTYTVTVTAANGCTDTESVAVTQNITPPVAAITNNTGSTELTCSRTSISVTATGGGTYSWSNGTSVVGTAAALSITAPGTYTVTVTAANGCTDTESVAVTQNITPPVAAITNNTGSTELTCSRTSISVTATGGGTYSWSDGSTVVGTNALLLITAPGTYTVTVTAANGCTDTESVAVTQNITPPVAAITNNTGSTELTCSRTSISVTATGGGTYSWSDGSTVVGTAAALSITAPGTYTVTVTGDNGCTATASISITQDETLPTAGITNNTGTTELTCTLTSISVTATGGVSYSWSDGSTVVGTAAALSITAPGTYTVTVTGDNGCTATASISITKDEAVPTAAITNNTGTTILTCTTTSIEVTATGGVSYLWDGGATPTTAANSFSAPGTYTVTVTAANGCTATASIIITQDESIPSFTCPESQTVALNENCRIIVPNLIADLSGSDDCGVYIFTQNPTAGTQITLNDGETSTVVITASNSNDKTTSCDVVLTAEDATSPSFTCPQAQDVNLNASCELIVPDLVTLLTGSDNCGTVTFTQSPMAGTALPSGHNQTHDVIITANDGNGNTSTCTVTLTGKDVTPPVITTCPTVVTIENKPGRCYAEFNLSSPSSLFGDLAFEDNCSGAYVGSILTMWNWQDPFNPLINRFNVGDHNITVTVKDKAGNTASCTYIIRIIDSENPTALCKPATVTLDADGNGTLAVSDINNGSKDNCGIQSLLLSQTSFTCNDIGNNNVTLTITDNSGNVAECTAVVTVVDGSAPTADITNNSGTTVLTCATTSISVTATGGVSYSWDGGTSLNTAENSFNVPGIYTVTVTTANGCISTASINITQDITPPTAAITNNTGSTILTCTTTSIDVTATGGVSYSWDGGLTPATAANSFIAPGTYTVTVTGDNGCTATASISITQDETLPTAGITNNTGTTELTCTLTSISVTATGGGTYSWSNGTSVVGTAAALSVTAPGTYTVTVTGDNGCTATASISITQDETLPTAGITNNTGTTELTCTLTSISVTATGGVSYSWSDGSTVVGTNALLLITAPGTYTVTVTGDNGCTATASISITQDETLPTAGITNNTGTTELTCTLTSISVTATGGGTYSWSDGSTVVGTAAALSITAPGTYTVTVTGDNGCTATASISITQDETLPTAGITNNTGTTELTCTLTSISVTATGGGTYSWSNGSTVVGTAAALSITAPGTYTVTVTGDNGCTATASISITQDETLPTAGITNNTGTTELTCTLTSISVTATGGVSYSWSDGSTVVGTTQQPYSITAPGTYTVTVTGDNGCTATASISITQDETLPTAGITNNTGTTELTCTLTSISVTATGGVSYSWSDGSTVVGTAAALSITAPGTYTVTVTGANGCTATASISITQDETLPTAAITNNTGTTDTDLYHNFHQRNRHRRSKLFMVRWKYNSWNNSSQQFNSTRHIHGNRNRRQRLYRNRQYQHHTG
jgi:hypothetical protein